MKKYTHAVAVGAHIIHQGRMLFVFRNTSPIAWSPPGGRLDRYENPFEGLHREIYEECRLQVEIICPTTIWYGMHKGTFTIGIFFFCKIAAGELTLSAEHSDVRWFTLEEIHQQINIDDRSIAFGTYTDYERAFLIADIFLNHNGLSSRAI